MLNKTSNILNVFAKKPWMKYTLKDIKKNTQSKSESYTYNTIKNFVKENILFQEKIGNVILYSVSHSQKAVSYLSFAAENEAWNKKHIPYKDIENIIPKIPTDYFTFIITGSYASNKQTKKSDIDAVIISDTEKKKIYAELRHICEINIPPIHLYVFTTEEFINMLLDKKPNYGKEIANNSLVLYGAEAYYKIILKAIKNGFTG